MRAIKATTSTVLIVGLLAGSVVRVAAQGEAAGSSGLVTEEVEPGVERIISDGAGHDLDAMRATYRSGFRGNAITGGIAITPDGTVWLATTPAAAAGTDDADSPHVWALGEPGGARVPEGVWVEDQTPVFLVSDVDGELLFIADAVVRVEGESFVPHDGPLARRLRAGGMMWLIEPDQLATLLPEGEFGFLCAYCGVLPVVWDGWKWISLSDYGSRVDLGSTSCQTGGDGVTCVDEQDGEVTRYLQGTGISQIVQAPDFSVWAVGDHGGDSLGLYRITPA